MRKRDMQPSKARAYDQYFDRYDDSFNDDETEGRVCCECGQAITGDYYVFDCNVYCEECADAHRFYV